MPAIPLYPSTPSRSPVTSNPLPSLIHTPSGLALLEIQGTLHFSPASLDVNSHPSLNSSIEKDTIHEPSIGRIVFPDYDPSFLGEEHPGWTKKVYLYVGKHQRLPGELKRLAKPIAVLRKRGRREKTEEMDMAENRTRSEDHVEELEIVEIVRYKILFAGRPEPVGD